MRRHSRARWVSALVAVTRSILVIARHRRHLDPTIRDLVRQLQAVGHQVALTPASA
ncbi:hypothetical protein [Streptomyces olivochromogenes]|uniref:hypothetical protein n=1 Tax=Streptomyces olivochromogenes TaxID=1963 RepID=UPI000A752F9A|nr:hypothetical protein [Streptomyces olivochromogenes]